MVKVYSIKLAFQNFSKFVVCTFREIVILYRREFQESASWYLLHDNAPAHSSGVVSEILAKQGIPVLSHPPYSPDLEPAPFFYLLN
jgi:transposase